MYLNPQWLLRTGPLKTNGESKKSNMKTNKYTKWLLQISFSFSNPLILYYFLVSVSYTNTFL